MKHLSLIVVLALGLGVAHGQTSSFDSTKHFIKGIYFVLKDSTGKKNTIYKDIKYETKIITEWNYGKKKWETMGPYTEVKGGEFYPREEVSMIDSVFFADKYSIEKFIVHVTFNGGEMDTETKNNFLDEIKKEQLRKYSKRDCNIDLELLVKNNKGQKQDLIIKIH